jgi:dUTP pyrophosphatase
MYYSKDTNAYPLFKAHTYDAGFDLSTAETVMCESGEVTIINTGIHIALKPWQVALVQPRSSTAKKGLLVITGVIDAGYTGAIKIQVLNFTKEAIVVNSGMRLAQLVIHNNSEYSIEPELVALDEVLENAPNGDNRGDNGFGSSGS